MFKHNILQLSVNQKLTLPPTQRCNIKDKKEMLKQKLQIGEEGRWAKILSQERCV